MQTRKLPCWALGLALVVDLAASAAWAQHSHHSFSIGAGPGMSPAPHHLHHQGLFAVGGGYSYAYGFPFYGSFAFNTVPFGYLPPLLMMAPAMPQAGGLLAGPMPPPGLIANQGFPPAAEAAKPRKPDPSRAAQLVTLGDRNFRAANVHRAAERYTQAIAADPNAAAPRVRMAQIALIRGHFAEAARQFREATVAEPGWLTHAPDIQAIYAEPADFARQIAKLETRLQADPHDRDAWFVLGAQWFLSGQTRRAADVFLRLTDRKPDTSLAAFLDASTPHPALAH